MFLFILVGGMNLHSKECPTARNNRYLGHPNQTVNNACRSHVNKLVGILIIWREIPRALVR